MPGGSISLDPSSLQLLPAAVPPPGSDISHWWLLQGWAKSSVWTAFITGLCCRLRTPHCRLPDDAVLHSAAAAAAELHLHKKLSAVKFPWKAVVAVGCSPEVSMVWSRLRISLYLKKNDGSYGWCTGRPGRDCSSVFSADSLEVTCNLSQNAKYLLVL